LQLNCCEINLHPATTVPCLPGTDTGSLQVLSTGIQNTYNWVGEMVNSFFIMEDGAVDSVDDERRPTDNEHDDDVDQRHCDVSLLFVGLAFVGCRTVSQVLSIDTDLP